MRIPAVPKPYPLVALIASLAVAGALAIVAARADDGTAAGREVAWLNQLADNGDTNLLVSHNLRCLFLLAYCERHSRCLHC